jgi:hypothetical protein
MDIAAMPKMREWRAFEKMINNQIFRFYKDILKDGDVTAARKLIFFGTALRNFPKSLARHGQNEISQIQTNQNSKASEEWADEETGEIKI